jgi:hypothetical protein
VELVKVDLGVTAVGSRDLHPVAPDGRPVEHQGKVDQPLSVVPGPLTTTTPQPSCVRPTSMSMVSCGTIAPHGGGCHGERMVGWDTTPDGTACAGLRRQYLGQVPVGV